MASRVYKLYRRLYLRRTSLLGNQLLGYSPWKEGKIPKLPNFKHIRDRLANAKVMQTDFRKTIKKYDSGETFFYLDPTYGEKWLDKNGLTLESFISMLKKIKAKFLLTWQDNDKVVFQKHFNVERVDAGSRRHLSTGRVEQIHELIITNFETSESEDWIVKQAEVPAHDYDQSYYQSFFKVRDMFITDFAAVLPLLKGESVLDVGCGVGTALSVLGNSGKEAVGVDKSVEAIRLCEQGDLVAQVGNATDLDFKAGSFDNVISLHLLEHLDDPVKAVKESIRVAKHKAVHIIPLGDRPDSTHKQVWKTEADFAKMVEYVECTKTFRRLPHNNLMVCCHVDFKDDWFADTSDQMIIPDFVSVVGSRARESDSEGDVDLVIRQEERDTAFELVLRNMFAEEFKDKLHYIYNSQGPHGDHVPLMDLVGRFKSDLEVKEIEKAVFTPVSYIRLPKPAAAYYINRVSEESIDFVWEKWAGDRVEKDGAVDVELKYNGWRMCAQTDGEGNHLLYTERKRKNRIKDFPTLAEDLGLFKEPVAFDIDIGAIGENGKPLPRADLALFGVAGKKIGRQFVTPAGVKGTLVVTCFHLLYYGEDMRPKSWKEMRKVLEAVVASQDFQTLRVSKSKVVKSKSAFMSAVKQLAIIPGSEGVVLKEVNDSYSVSPGGLETGWAKAKNVVRVAVSVVKKEKIDGKIWSYTLGVKKGDEIITIGKALNTSVDVPIGSILDVDVEEVMPKWDGKNWNVGFVVPIVAQESTRGTPMTAVEAIKEADRSNVLQANADMEKLLRAKKVIKISSADAQLEVVDKKKETEFRASPEGNLDFKEGDSGKGVWQLHEMGLTEEEAKKEIKEGVWAAHMDFRLQRLKPGKDEYWEGGEVFTPGSPKKRNKIMDYRDAEKMLMNFKVPRKEARRGKKGPFIVRGPLEWMKVGKPKPFIMPPGTSGALAKSWARMTLMESMDWKAGTQDRHYKEFWFDYKTKLKALSGRWIMTYAPLRAGRHWLIMRPKEQRMDAERKKGEVIKWKRQSPILS